MSVLKKRIIVYCLLAVLAFACLPPSFGRRAYSASPAAENVAAVPVLYNGASFDYFPSFSDIAFDSQYYYLLSGNRVYMYNDAGYYAETEELDSPVSLALYDKLLLVVAGNGSGGSEVVFFDTHSLAHESRIAPAFTYDAAEFGGSKLKNIVTTPQSGVSSASTVWISNFDGTFYSFAGFTLDLKTGDVELAVSDTIYYITPKSAVISAGAQAINAAVYGDYIFAHNTINGIYFATASGIKHMSLISPGIPGIVDIPALPVNSPELCYAKGQLIYSDGGTLKIFDGGTDSLPFFAGGVSVFPSLAAFYDETLLIADNTAKSISHFSLSGEKLSDVVLSKGSGEGYFDSPLDIYTRNGMLAVADKGNSRVQIFASGGVTSISEGLTAPSKVLIDSNGSVYVYDSGKILSYDFIGGEYIPASGSFADANISDFALGNDGSFYYISGAAVFVRRKNETKFSQYRSFNLPKKLAVPSMTNALYILSQSSVIKYDGTDTTTYPLTGIANPLDLALDDGGNIYILCNDNKVYKFKENDGSLELAAYVDSYSSERNMSPGSINGLFISDVSDGVVARGDILLCDSAQNLVRKIDRSILDVEYYDGSNPAFSAPVDYADPTPLDEGVSICRLTESAYLYSSPTGTGSLLRMKSGESVVILAKNIIGNDFFSFVAYADNLKKTTEYGYVSKNSLGAPLTEQPPPYSDGRIFNYSAYVFKYPSTDSVKLKDEGGADKQLFQGDEFRILGFVPDYKDNCMTAWFKISLGGDSGAIGYISSANAVYKGFLPIIGNQPKTDGYIESGNITGINVYEKSGSEYILLRDISIANGTRVKIVGTFDPNSEYTRIRCATEFGILDCYVNTYEVRYDGINILQITVIVMILVSVTTVAIAIGFYMKKKKSKKRY